MSLTFKEVSAFAHLIDSEPGRVVALDASALPHLQRLLADKQVWVAARAAGLVPLIDDKKAISVLMKAAQSPHDEVRVAAAAGAWRLARHGVDDLVSVLLRDPDAGVQRFALRSVGRAHLAGWSPSSEEVPRYVQYLKERGSPMVRALATHVLERLRDVPTTDEEVLEALSSSLPPADVGDVLGDDATDELARRALDEDPKIAARAVAVAAESPNPRLSVITAAAEHPHPEVRIAAAVALRRVDGDQIDELAGVLLRDEVPDVRYQVIAAAAANRRLKEPRVRPLVAELAREDPDERVRALAAEALARLRKRRS